MATLHHRFLAVRPKATTDADGDGGIANGVHAALTPLFQKTCLVFARLHDLVDAEYVSCVEDELKGQNDFPW